MSLIFVKDYLILSYRKFKLLMFPFRSIFILLICFYSSLELSIVVAQSYHLGIGIVNNGYFQLNRESRF
jgi:hypothetical protein